MDDRRMLRPGRRPAREEGGAPESLRDRLRKALEGEGERKRSLPRPGGQSAVYRAVAAKRRKTFECCHCGRKRGRSGKHERARLMRGHLDVRRIERWQLLSGCTQESVCREPTYAGTSGCGCRAAREQPFSMDAKDTEQEIHRLLGGQAGEQYGPPPPADNHK